MRYILTSAKYDSYTTLPICGSGTSLTIDAARAGMVRFSCYGRLSTITEARPLMARRKRPTIHPGEHLRDELEELGLSARAFARLLDIPVNRVTQILNGQRGITADTALRLARYFGTSAEFWMNLQQIYELRLAEQHAGREIASRVRPRAA